MTDHDAIAAKVRRNKGDGTPGPWVSSFESVDPEWAIVTTNGGAVVANVNADSRQEANARRIAALPDLEAAYLDLYDEVTRLRAERDRLRAALNEIASAASGIAHDLQIGPEDEGRDIYDMVLAIRDDARAALKGTSE